MKLKQTGGQFLILRNGFPVAILETGTSPVEAAKVARDLQNDDDDNTASFVPSYHSTFQVS